jgi:preprotein translocase subunit YajC
VVTLPAWPGNTGSVDLAPKNRSPRVSGDQLGALLPLLLLVAVFWLLVMRPARNRQRQAAALQSELSLGSQVMLTSGVFGTVTWLGDETVRVEIAPETVIRVHRQAVGRVLGDEEADRMANETEDVPEPTEPSDSADSMDTEQTDKGD